MSPPFEVLGSAQTPTGLISLWRRNEPRAGTDVYEVKLGDEYLMSSLFTVAEIELSRLGLAAVDGASLDVVVGGLGLGYTALAALEDERVAEVLVVDAIAEVIAWHEQRLLPDVDGLTLDPRTRLVHGDFFALAASEDGFDEARPGRTFDAILVDIDHTPSHHLDADHADFYTVAGMRRLANHLRPGGVFALWSDEPPTPELLEVLEQAFGSSEGHTVPFDNVLTGGTSTNGVYLATTPAQTT